MKPAAHLALLGCPIGVALVCADHLSGNGSDLRSDVVGGTGGTDDHHTLAHKRVRAAVVVRVQDVARRVAKLKIDSKLACDETEYSLIPPSPSIYHGCP